MKKVGAVGLALILAVNMTACGSTDISLTDSAEEIGLEVSWWGSDDRNSYTIDALREYEKKNSNIKIHMTYGEFSGFELKNDVKMFAKTEADIMQINYSWVEKYQQQGLTFYDMNKLSDYIDLSQYDETELSYGKNAAGEQIALPIAINVEVAWYNKTIFDSYGLSLPKTWDDVYAAAKVMSKDGIYVLDMDDTAIWQSSVAYVEQTTGHTVFDKNNNFAFSKDDVKKMISFYIDLVNKGVVERVADRNETKINEGVYAGTLQWVSGAAKYEEMIKGNNGNEVAVELAPGADDGKRPGWYVKPATLYMIGAHTKHPKEAAKLLNYMVSDKGMVSKQLLEKGVPSNDKAIKILDQENDLAGAQYDATVLAQEKNFPLMSPYFETATYQQALRAAIDQVLYGQATLDKAAKTAYAAMTVPNH